MSFQNLVLKMILEKSKVYRSVLHVGSRMLKMKLKVIYFSPKFLLSHYSRWAVCMLVILSFLQHLNFRRVFSPLSLKNNHIFRIFFKNIAIVFYKGPADCSRSLDSPIGSRGFYSFVSYLHGGEVTFSLCLL